MKLTSEDYTALRVFLLKVINRSEDSLEEVEVLAVRDVLNKLLNVSEEPKEFIANYTGFCYKHTATLTTSGHCPKCDEDELPF